MDDIKKETIDKWNKLGLLDGLTDFENFSGNTFNDFSTIQFPIIKRVFSKTLAGGGWIKSKKQQLKENRINKLRELEGKKPNVILPEDEYIDVLVSVHWQHTTTW